MSRVQPAQLRPIDVSPVGAWVTARNQQADVLRAAQNLLQHLHNAPLAPGESGLARIAAADKAKADVTAATAALRSIEHQAPRSPLAVVGGILARSRQAVVRALTQAPAKPDRAPIDAIRRRVKRQHLIETLRRPLDQTRAQERDRTQQRDCEQGRDR